MKNNLILIAVAVTLFLSSVGCNKGGKLDTPSSSPPPAGPVEMKLKWSPGERIVQDMDTKMNMEVAVPGQHPMNQDMTMGQEFGLTVLNESPDGSHELELEFLSARIGMKMGDKTMLDYDSARSSSADQTNLMAGIFGKIVGSKIQMYLDASNSVEHVEGVDAMLDRMTSGGQAAALASIKGMFNADYFKQMVSYSRFLPPMAVQPGDTWPVHYQVPMATFGTLDMNYNLTFKGWEKHGERNCARLEFVGTITGTPAANSAGMSVSVQDGQSSGVSWFDPELGITTDTTMNQDMTMAMNLPAGASPGGAPQTITTHIKQDLDIKLVSVK